MLAQTSPLIYTFWIHYFQDISLQLWRSEVIQNISIVVGWCLLSLAFSFYLYFSYFFRSLLTGNLSLACCFCCAPYHFEHLSTTHSTYSWYATSPILRSHPFFIFHTSPNLTFHTVWFCCQFVIVLILGYKISSFTVCFIIFNYIVDCNSMEEFVIWYNKQTAYVTELGPVRNTNPSVLQKDRQKEQAITITVYY